MQEGLVRISLGIDRCHASVVRNGKTRTISVGDALALIGAAKSKTDPVDMNSRDTTTK